ncbi:hypothetical protein [Microtetraspora glauca]|uniref:Uncharacterized protein n=1 Tax=Microtetraspora glauca TaxID=1996 RepID=A0ABV3GIX8_MICGL
MNLSKSLFRVLVGAALLGPIVVPATAAAASAETAPSVQIVLNTVTSWQPSESGGDDLYVRMVGPTAFPIMPRDVIVFPKQGSPGADGWFTMTAKAKDCFSTEGAPCPSGTNAIGNTAASQLNTKPVFLAIGGWAYIEIWDYDIFSDHERLVRVPIKLDPLTSPVQTRIRLAQGADYEVDFTLFPSWKVPF